MELVTGTKRTGNNGLIINLDILRSGESQWFLLRSDAHADNPESQSELEIKHLDQALERNAGIIDLGDLHDAMQGRADKRSCKSGLKTQLLTRAYWDELTDFMVNRYGKYAKNWIVQAHGNHETSVMNKLEIDLIERFSAVMNSTHNGVINALGYSGFIRFQFKTKSAGKSGYTMYFTHGHGGGGKTTQGLPSLMRLNMNVDDVDIIAAGHTHNAYNVEIAKTFMSRRGKIEDKICHIVQIPTYKDGFKKGYLGWEAERGIGPKPLGGWWMRFYRNKDKEPVRLQFIRTEQ